MTQPASELTAVAAEGAPKGMVDSLIEEISVSGSDLVACSTVGNTVDAEAIDSANFENDSTHEAEVEADNATSLTGMQGTQEISTVVGEPFTTYMVGFGRNPFGRFSLTAAWNEQTGEMSRTGKGEKLNIWKAFFLRTCDQLVDCR